MAELQFFSIPDICPVCSSSLTIEGDFLYCQAKSCPVRLSGAIKVWVDRLGLLHWGDALIGSLTDPEKTSSIQSVGDLYRLSVEDIQEHCSGPKMAKKCWKTLHDNTSVPLEIVLAGMNIANLGLATATDIVKAGHDSIDKVLALTLEQLQEIPNIGEITALQIRNGLDSRRDTLLDLASILDITLPISGPLRGKKVCITGDVWAPRKAVQKMVTAAGGQAVDSVSKDTSFLVCDDSSSTSSKAKRAASYGIPIIKGADLKNILDGVATCDEIAKR